MDIFQIALVAATFLCSLVAGFVFAFAVVIMPGISSLSDAGFIRAFQVMDRIIQNRQPLFMVVWVGSVLALLTATVVGFARLDQADRALLIGATIVYLLGVQLPTATVNVPLNNQLQTLNIDASSEEAHHAARDDFEVRWNRWNTTRTMFAGLASVLLLVLLFRL